MPPTMMRGCWLLLLALSLCACPRGTATPSQAPAPRYLKGQLHLHSSRSGDSRTSPDEVVRWYGEHGFDFIVFTDHSRIALPLRSAGPLVLAGIELTQNVSDCTPPPAPGEQ